MLILDSRVDESPLSPGAVPAALQGQSTILGNLIPTRVELAVGGCVCGGGRCRTTVIQSDVIMSDGQQICSISERRMEQHQHLFCLTADAVKN